MQAPAPLASPKRILAASTLIGLLLAACGPSSTAGGGGASPAAKQLQSSAPIGAAQCEGQACLDAGGFSPAFVEPVIYEREPSPNGLPGTNPLRPVPDDDRCQRGDDGRPTNCKPAAGSAAVLADGRVLYFNALEGSEDVEFSVVSEYGQVIENDQTRVLGITADTATFLVPDPVAAGAESDATPLLPGGLGGTSADDGLANSGALFCADLDHLADGRLIAVGGTNYYFEPGVTTPFPIGISELEGIRNSRIFDPRSNRWTQTGSMMYGRWYPSTVTLETGDVFVASGVTKLLKPVYPDRPETSGRNVAETETYDLGCGVWNENGSPASRSLPLFPRLHLLPNGEVLYNAAGQAFNPFGQGYDQALWNIIGTYDPANPGWTDVAYGGLPLLLNATGIDQLSTALNPANPAAADAMRGMLERFAGQLTADPAALIQPFATFVTEDPAALDAKVMSAIGGGFRGSTFSILLPLKPDAATGQYTRAEVLTAGGVLGGAAFTNPGSHVATNLSRIDRYDTGGGRLGYESRLTGPLNAARWYGTGVLLPTGEVMVFSGADRDEVQYPGGATPITVTELFDPASETWRRMATQGHARTYHNTAALLPDGRVLVGGHSPINTGYMFSLTLPGMSPNDGRDPSFEIYSPPYAFKARPRVTSAPSALGHGQAFTLATPQADAIESVVLVRKTSITHLVDGDQRAIELPIESRSAGSLRVRMPAQRAVAPPGPYMLFVVQRDAAGRVPSVSAPVTVTGADSACSS